MSNSGAKRSFIESMRLVNAMGGVRAYYRGLTVSTDVDITLFTFQTRHMNDFTLL
jgi:hypothetical protein